MTVAIGSLFAAVVWTIWWITNYLGIAVHLQGNNVGGDEDAAQAMDGGIVFLLLICFYWAHQVISNVVHVTVAGTVGTWWFTPDIANSCCSQAVKGSMQRATTTSLGR